MPNLRHRLPFEATGRVEPNGGSSTSSAVPHVQAFNEHNGNEARQTYHGLPSGYVQPLLSPQTFVFNPMQINTNDGSGARGGPLPRASAAPAGAKYNGVLECPCTTRVVKDLKRSTINGRPYNPHCTADRWRSDLLATHNPTCNVSTYVGGMECCQDGEVLLDADQQQPEHIDEVRFKWRFVMARAARTQRHPWHTCGSHAAPCLIGAAHTLGSLLTYSYSPAPTHLLLLACSYSPAPTHLLLLRWYSPAPTRLLLLTCSYSPAPHRPLLVPCAPRATERAQYHEPYDVKRHTPLVHLEWAVNGCDSGGPHGASHNCPHIEYDAVKAPEGTSPEKAVHEVTSHFQLRDMLAADCDPATDEYCASAATATARGGKMR